MPVFANNIDTTLEWLLSEHGKAEASRARGHSQPHKAASPESQYNSSYPAAYGGAKGHDLWR